MMPQAADRLRSAGGIPFRLPSWRTNLAFFGLLILITLAYFLYQLRAAREVFTAHVLEHTRLLAEVIERQARAAILSRDVIDEIVGTHLGAMARFIAYLNAIEPFQARELTAFALESGLAGIAIQRRGTPPVEGPPGWRTALPETACADPQPMLRSVGAPHLYRLAWLEPGADNCIQVGLAAERMETLQSHIGIDHLLATLEGMPGIRYVRLAPKGAQTPGVTLRQHEGQTVAEARLAMGERLLVVGGDTRFFYSRISEIRFEFAIFAGILSVAGVLLSLALYRHQASQVHQARAFERTLARERQDAALGRSAASIAHEIRNPLNAIDMGLQRLQFEAPGLEAEHRDLIRSLRQAVARTNGIVSDLQQFARPLAIDPRPVRIDELLTDLLRLYQPAIAANGIAMRTCLDRTPAVAGSRDLLQAAIENLVRNAIEAQPGGGDLFIGWSAAGSAAEGRLAIENGGLRVPPEELDKILEPYYTRNTRGTGLGVPIAVRIFAAHGGALTLRSPAPDRIRVEVRLPLAAAAGGMDRSGIEDGTAACRS